MTDLVKLLTVFGKESEDGFDEWARAVKHVLTANDEQEALTNEADDKSKKVHAILALFTHGEANDIVCSVDKAKKAWDALHTRYSRVSATERINLFAQLTDRKWTESAETFYKYKTDVLNMVKKINANKQVVDDEIVIQMVKRQLPSHLINLAEMEARVAGVTAITFMNAMEVIARDRAHAAAPAAPPGAGAASHTALHANTVDDAAMFTPHGQPRHPRDRNGGPRNGGHRNGPPRQVPPTDKCHNCQGLGHHARTCSSPRDIKHAKYNSDQVTATQHPTTHDHSQYVFDTGATQHILRGSRKHNSAPITQVRTVDGNLLPAYGPEHHQLLVSTSDGAPVTLPLKDALIMPSAQQNLVSINQLLSDLPDNAEYVQTRHNAHIHNGAHEIPLTIEPNGLVVPRAAHTHPDAAALATSQSEDIALWHARLGHTHTANVRTALRDANIHVNSKADKHDGDFCKSCALAKSTKRPIPNKAVDWEARADHVIQLDIAGPFDIPSAQNHRYLFVFVHAQSRWIEVYPAKAKSEAPEILARFHTDIQTRPHKTIPLQDAIIHTDNEIVLASADFLATCARLGLRHRSTAPESQARDGLAERAIDMITSSGRAMQAASQCSPALWPHFFRHAAYVKNMIPHRALNKSPFEALTGRTPDIRRLRVFGCEAYVHVPRANRRKLDPSGRAGIYIGESFSSPAHIILVDGRVVESAHVVFNERWTPSQLPATLTHPPPGLFLPTMASGGYAPPHTGGQQDALQDDATSGGEHASGSESKSESENESESENDSQSENESESESKSESETQSESESKSESESETQSENKSESESESQAPSSSTDGNNPPPAVSALRRSERTASKSISYHPAIVRITPSALATIASTVVEPNSYRAASQEPGWREAMEKEVHELEEAKTFEITPLSHVPADVRIFPTVFTFRVKHDEHGNPVKLKARLCARGDLEETEEGKSFFSPTGSHTIVRLLLTLAGALNFYGEQVDIRNAFTAAPTPPDSNYFIHPPPNRPQTNENGERIVYRCAKNLYGFRGAPKAFYEHMSKILGNLQFTRSTHEPCLFFKKTTAGTPIFIFAFVDDNLILSPDPAQVRKTIDDISKSLKVTRLGQIHHYLNIGIQRDNNGAYHLSQAHTLRAILEESNMADSRPVGTPLEMGTLDNDSTTPLSDEDADTYRSILGKLLYVATNTRPDLIVAVAVLSQFSKAPQERHYIGLKHLLRYVRGSVDLRLTLGTANKYKTVTGFSDADWGRDQNRKTRTGYAFYLFGLISWRTQLQHPCLSSAEAELVALCSATQEGLYLHHVLEEMHQFDARIPTAPPHILGDNQAALKTAATGAFSRELRHVDTKYRFIHHHIENGRLSVDYIPTQENNADPLTKVLAKTKNQQTRARLLQCQENESGGVS